MSRWKRPLFIASLIGVCLLLPFTVMASFRPVELLNSCAAGKTSAVAVDQDERIFSAQEKGGVQILSATGQHLATLDGKDAKDSPLLARPGGIAFFGERIYVSDKNLGRIVIFDRNGQFRETFGRDGDAPKEFSSPQGLAFFGGALYVADNGNDRVQVFTPEGIYLFSIGRTGIDESLLNNPTQLAFAPQGKLFVLDESGQIKMYKPTGEYLGRIATTRTASAIAADAEGLFLADAKSLQVCKIDYQGKELFSFGSKGKDGSQFLSIASLAADHRGNLTIADPRKELVQTFSTAAPPPLQRFDVSPPLTGVVWRQTLPGPYSRIAVSPTTSRLYAIRTDVKNKSLDIIEATTVVKNISLPKWDPVAVAIGTDESIWVLDQSKPQVLRLSDEGKILHGFGTSGSRDGCFDDPSDLVVSPKGLIYVADTDNRRIQVFNSGGTLLHILKGKGEKDIFDKPTALALAADETLYVLDAHRGLVSIFNPEGQRIGAFGSLGAAFQQFKAPVDVALSPDEVFVLDSGLASVRVFSRKGEFLRSFATEGDGKGDLKVPSALLVVDQTTLLVADTGNARLQNLSLVYVPPAPLNLRGEAGPRKVSLLWDKSTQHYVEGYRVYRKFAGEDDFQFLKETTANSLCDLDVLPGRKYTYRVTATARGGHESTADKEFDATPTKLIAQAPTSIRAVPQEWSVDLSWGDDPTGTAVGYRVYRMIDGKPTLIGKTATTTFYDGNLDPETVYQYSLTAVSIDEVESEPSFIKTTTLIATRPPIEIEVVKMEDVFSNTYKMYETEGIGKLRISNNTSDQIAKIKLSFAIKDYMDYPSEFEISDLKPRSSQEVTLKAVFNNLVLNLTEDTPVQGELTASYYKNQTPIKFSKIQTVRLFEKHRIIWDEAGRFSAFVTPKDPVILEFGRSIASQFSEYGDPILFAGMSFDALGVLGIGYLQDPSNPYQETSEKTDVVDYLQYPRETLSRKSGDCDDLVGLYASILESLGIQTKVVEVPGHMFMIFATPQTRDSVPKSFVEMYVEHEGVLWIPVEVTSVGAPFMKSWETGIKHYNEWQGRGLTLMDVRSAWTKFKPASLPMTDWKPQGVSKEQIDGRFKDDLLTLRKIRLQNLGQQYINLLQDDPNDAAALLQLGIIYAKNEEPLEALPPLEKACKLNPADPSVHNNLGNVYYLLNRYEEAAVRYAEAVKLDGSDPYVWVNYARTLLRLDKKREATEAYDKAMALRPEIRNQFKTLSITLGTPY